MKSGFPYIPAFRIAIFLLVGIVLQLQHVFSSEFIWICFIGLTTIFCVLFLTRMGNRSIKLIKFQGSIFILACMFCGSLLVELDDPRNQSSYFGKYLSDAETFRCRVTEPPEIKENSIKLTVEVQEMYRQSFHTSTVGNAIIYLAKNDLNVIPKYGNEVIIKNNFSAPASTNNPGAFDYAKYLKAHKIFYTAYLKNGEFLLSDNFSPKPFWNFIFNCRQYFSRQITENIHDQEVQGIALALILGNRTLLDNETRDHFAKTGTMHVLAVSGLHVGIFYAILEILLNLIPFFKKNKTNSYRYIKPIIIVTCIWIYGCITGLSPSIFRSAVMFTMLAFGRLDGQHINSYNILSASAILLFFINPFMVMEVGFQLSFLAVLGIVAFQPYLYKLIKVKHPIPKYIWSLASVSIGAQIGTIPITIFYFHQFPNYFLLTNMVAIPMAFLTLVSGVFLFTISWISPLASIAGWLVYIPIKIMNESMAFANTLPGATVEYIHWSLLQTIVMCLLIFIAAIILTSKNKDYIYAFIITLLLFMVFTLQTVIQRKSTKELSFIQIKNNTLLSVIYENTLYLLTEEKIDNNSTNFNYIIKPALQQYGIDSYQTICLDSNFKSNSIVISGSTIIIGNKIINTITNNSTAIATLPASDYLLICNNPFLNLEQLAEKFKKSIWIFDNTNSYKSIKYWEKFCLDNNIRFHNLKSEGALNIRL
ncbi:MAG: ComEC family competence protein [Chitinophagales bacterium]|nr:ComEC family competence protein [Chitinophagales bacterium]MBP8754361.1 ComEC family competence protein [Chitinophagales bacterium]MBP9190238.1 ComEC family competence protein [Chitinophagales bacterium]MBP9703716.1 ComEC family competence protein [Chitinophagales bacterium]